MSRKDYELIVAALAAAYNSFTPGSEAAVGVIRATSTIALALQGDNPRFNADRFSNAFWEQVAESLEAVECDQCDGWGGPADCWDDGVVCSLCNGSGFVRQRVSA